MNEHPHKLPLTVDFLRIVSENRSRVRLGLDARELPPYDVFVDRLFKQLPLITPDAVVALLGKHFQDGTLDMNSVMESLDEAGKNPNGSAMHAAIGCSGESGELLDVVKKVFLYNKAWSDLNEEKLDALTHVLEELADHRFYYQKFLNMLNITDEDVCAYSYTKLSKRYASGRYSDTQAQQRADKRTFLGAERRQHNKPTEAKE